MAVETETPSEEGAPTNLESASDEPDRALISGSPEAVAELGNRIAAMSSFEEGRICTSYIMIKSPSRDLKRAHHERLSSRHHVPAGAGRRSPR